MEEKKNIVKNNETPSFVYRDGVVADKEYVEWLADVKTRFRQSQIKASIRVNTSMLEFYWSVGRDLVALRAEERWGAGVVKQFALDMRRSFPDATGFSHTNVKYMKQWYSFYYERVAKSHQVGDQLASNGKSQRIIGQLECEGKSQRVVGQFEMPELFGRIPWGQHIDIVSRCKSLEEALFYAQSVLDNGWSRPVLNAKIDSDLFHLQGSAITNFDLTLPASQSDSAKELLKKEYDLTFVTYHYPALRVSFFSSLGGVPERRGGLEGWTQAEVGASATLQMSLPKPKEDLRNLNRLLFQPYRSRFFVIFAA